MFRMKYLFVMLTLLACLLPQLAPCVRAADLPDDQTGRIVAAVLAAYGGREAVERVRGVTARGTIVDFMKGTEGGYARYYQRPGKLRIEIMPERGGEVRILADGRGWQAFGGAFREARPVTLQSMIYQYSYLDLPMGFLDNSYPVTFGGSQTSGGRTLDTLVLSPKGAPQLRVSVDRETHLIVRVAADFDMGMGASELSTRYEDFRPVGGVLFPFRLVNYAGEMRLSAITIAELKVAAPVAAGLFTPQPGAAVPR